MLKKFAGRVYTNWRIPATIYSLQFSNATFRGIQTIPAQNYSPPSLRADCFEVDRGDEAVTRAQNETRSREELATFRKS